MDIKKDSTEDKILEAAKNVFVAKGMEGARMQEIADEAGINKALLHYYFRSKERLFEAIFSEIIKYAFPKLSKVLQSESAISSKIEQFIDAYIDILRKHPFIPGFIMKELSRDPSFIFRFVTKHGLDPQPVFKNIQAAMDRGEIVKMDPRHLAINIVSMCVFPFAARPVLSFVIFKDDKQALDAFYAERADVIKQFVINAIVVNNKEKG